MSSPSVLADARLYELLLKFDGDLAACARRWGCRCGGVLHRADYERKPRGALAALPAGYESRFSFCCAQDGCRRRTTPASIRYLGRKVYLGVVVVLVTAMERGGGSVGELCARIGVSRRTVVRWRRWWQTAFATSAFWQAARGLLAGAVAIEALPASLLARFVAPDEGERLIRLLDFIKPVTTTAWGNREGISMGR